MDGSKSHPYYIQIIIYLFGAIKAILSAIMFNLISADIMPFLKPYGGFFGFVLHVVNLVYLALYRGEMIWVLLFSILTPISVILLALSIGALLDKMLSIESKFISRVWSISRVSCHIGMVYLFFILLAYFPPTTAFTAVAIASVAITSVAIWAVFRWIMRKMAIALFGDRLIYETKSTWNFWNNIIHLPIGIVIYFAMAYVSNSAQFNSMIFELLLIVVFIVYPYSSIEIKSKT